MLLDQIVRPMSGLALSAVQKRICETSQMSARLPHSGIHQDIRIQFIAVFPQLDKIISPRILDLIFQPCPQRSVIPRVCETSINLTSLINESVLIAVGHHLLHRKASFFHVAHPFLLYFYIIFILFRML